MQKENAEFELGKRHLANMMGMDAKSMTQQDIDEAIAYLLPSGLFSPRSRPTMKPPAYHYPPIKAAEFSEDGRPHNFLFYTARPAFFKHLYDVYEKVEVLDKTLQNQAEKVESQEGQANKIILTGTKWLNIEKVGEIFLERINEKQMQQFEAAMDYLAGHPLAHLEADFIFKFRMPIATSDGMSLDLATEIKTDENGREYTESEGRRKSINAFVKLYANGSGKFNIDGRDLMQFLMSDSREQLLFPFMILNRYDQFDVVARTEYTGAPRKLLSESGRVGAVRLAACKAMCPFLTAQEQEKLRLMGLLTRDPRRKERNKFQHIGARKRPTWKRR